MKKKVIYSGLVILAVFIVAVGCLYAIDISRMKNNEPVIFSTWGHSYAPPEEKFEPPVLKFNNKDGILKATCLIGTHSWKNGNEAFVSDYPHPVERQYSEENILMLDGDKEMFIYNKDAKIKEVRLYRSDVTDMLKYYIPFTDNSIVFDMPGSGEYIAEIRAEYKQGTVCYCLKVCAE